MKKAILILMTCISNYAYSGACQDFCYNDDRYGCNFYVKFAGGPNILLTESSNVGGVQADYKTGYIFSTALGYKLCYGFRIEAEYAYRRNQLKHVHALPCLRGNFQSNSYMFNLLWNFPVSSCTPWPIQPFVGGGIGSDTQRVRWNDRRNKTSFSNRQEGFAWQVLTGITYPIDPKTDVSIEYMFHQGGFSGYYSQSFVFGIYIKFGAGI